MTPYPDFTYTPGATLAIEAAGIVIVCQGGVWLVSDLVGAQAAMAAHDPLAYARAEQAALAAAARWNAMTGGHTTAAGIALATDPISISLITSLAFIAPSGVGAPYRFKDRNGAFQALQPADVAALWTDVSAFIQACYSAEAAIETSLNAAETWQAVMAVDPTAGFPAKT